MLGAFLGSLAQQVYLANALVTRISQTKCPGCQNGAAAFEQFEIVDSSGAKSRRHDFATGQVCHDLGF